MIFDIGAPSEKVTLKELPVDAQVCNCTGVSNGAIVNCVKSGKRSTKVVMDATRAGMGCGSCKSLVAEIIEWAAGGQIEEDPSMHYYVPGVPLAKPELILACREKNLKSVSAVFAELAGGKEDPASKPGLATLLATIWPNALGPRLREARSHLQELHWNGILPVWRGGQHHASDQDRTIFSRIR